MHLNAPVLEKAAASRCTCALKETLIFSSKSLIRRRFFVFLLPLFLSLPFLGRAYFVDDNYFVEIATWLKDNPTQPYHFRTDDAGLQNRGWEEDGFVRMVNPLAHHYYLAFLMKVGGMDNGTERVWFLRLGCVLLSCFSALFLFELARRWTQHPLLTATLAVVTPAFWMTAYSLLIDSTVLFFFLGALLFFVRGMETDSTGKFVVSGVLMGLAILSKYPGGLIVPVTMTWAFLNRRQIRRIWPLMAAWGIAIGFLGAYSAWTAHLYGAPHVLAASQRMVSFFGWPKLISFFVFLSGGTLLPIAGWGAARFRLKAASAAGFLLLMGFFMSPAGGFTWIQSGLLSLWLVTTFLFLGAFLQERKEWLSSDLFLFLWMIGFIVMMWVVMGWVAVRYFNLLVPALALGVVRLAEIQHPRTASFHLSALAGTIFLISAAIGIADARQAETSRAVLPQLQAAGYAEGPRRFYLGDSFTMSYVRDQGWVPAFEQTEFEPGDLLLAKEVTMPQIWLARRKLLLERVAEFNFPSAFPIRVMDYRGSAGFYASVWGALPFVWSDSPLEKFSLFRVISLRDGSVG